MNAEVASATPAMSTLTPRQRTLLLVSCIASYCVANATWWLQPVLIDQLQSVYEFSAAVAGLVVSIEMTAMALTSYWLAKVVKRSRFWVLAGGGIALALLGSFLSLSASTLAGLILTRMMVGIGEGFSFMVANTGMACFADRERAFGYMSVLNVLLGVALMSFLPMVPSSAHEVSGFLALLVALAILTPAILLMPPSHELVTDTSTAESVATASSREARKRILLLSLATFLIGAASGVLWSFYAVIGQGTGLSESAVNGAIALSIFTALAGSSLAAIVGKSFGRILPVTGALVLMTTAIACLSLHPSALEFRIATCVNVATLYFIVPFLFAAGSAQDENGLGATYVGSAFMMTGAISPFLGGLLVDSVGIRVVGSAVVVTSILAWIAFVYVIRASFGGMLKVRP